MNVLLLIALTLLFYGVLLLLKKPKKKYDPFGFHLTTISRKKCVKCGFASYENFKRGDYIYKKTGVCPKCKGELVIDMIYTEYNVSPKQRRWEEYCKKWR